MFQTLAAYAYMPVPVVGHGQGEWHDLLDIGPPSDAITVSVGPTTISAMDTSVLGKTDLFQAFFCVWPLTNYFFDLDYTEDYG
ncbi:MAG: hypothetical protein ABSC55_29025 [Syntrophorhabdales bacterium]|jgi:hypothetical protein